MTESEIISILNKNKIKTAIVTGGAGFVGSHLVDKLLEYGLRVKSIDNYVSGKTENLYNAKKYDKFEEINASITDENVVDKIMEDVDVVFHQAASKMTVCMKDPLLDLQVNAGGTLLLLQKAMKYKVKKFIHVSTGSVYGRAKYFPTDEEHSVNPVSLYGVSKLAGEKYARMYNEVFGLESVILRYFHVYGPRQENSDVGGVVSIFARNILEGKPIKIYGDGLQVRLFTYVDDVVRANIIAACKKEMVGKAYNCNSDNNITITNLAKEMAKLLEKPDHVIEYHDERIGDVKKFKVSNEALKNIGFSWSTDFSTGLNKTLEWSKEWMQNK